MRKRKTCAHVKGYISIQCTSMPQVTYNQNHEKKKKKIQKMKGEIEKYFTIVDVNRQLLGCEKSK